MYYKSVLSGKKKEKKKKKKKKKKNKKKKIRRTERKRRRRRKQKMIGIFLKRSPSKKHKAIDEATRKRQIITM